MTYQEFEQKVEKKTSFEKFWYYGLCIVVIILSLVLLVSIATQSRMFNGGHIFLYSILFFLLFLGTYGLYKLPNRYKIITIDTSHPLSTKKAAIETLLSKMNIVRTLNENYCAFKYRNGFWSSSYDVYIFYDDNSVCFSVQVQDYSDGGFIDLGGSEKLRKKIVEHIQVYLA